MRRIWWLIAGLSAGCAATSEGLVPTTPLEMVSPEADLSAPGMIPPECEQLLQKSSAWGYRPGEKWKPASIEIAKEASLFFSTFSLVPENTHKFYVSWENKPASKSVEEANAQVQLFEQAQVCDPNLTLSILDGVIQFPWPKMEKGEVGKNIHKFVLNQQARKSFLMQRAVSVQVLDLAYKRGLLKGSSANLGKIRNRIDNLKSTKLTKSPFEIEEIFRKELKDSDEIRAELSRLLPLP